MTCPGCRTVFRFATPMDTPELSGAFCPRCGTRSTFHALDAKLVNAEVEELLERVELRHAPHPKAPPHVVRGFAMVDFVARLVLLLEQLGLNSLEEAIAISAFDRLLEDSTPDDARAVIAKGRAKFLEEFGEDLRRRPLQ